MVLLTSIFTSGISEQGPYVPPTGAHLCRVQPPRFTAVSVATVEESTSKVAVIRWETAVVVNH